MSPFSRMPPASGLRFSITIKLCSVLFRNFSYMHISLAPYVLHVSCNWEK